MMQSYGSFCSRKKRLSGHRWGRLLAVSAAVSSGFLISGLGSSLALAQAESADPYLWLEEVEGERALEFAKEQSEATLASFEADKRFASLTDAIEKINLSQDRLPTIAIRNGYIYNLWQDAKNLRGLWRRAPLKEFVESKARPQWETILDLDALAAQEGQSWVWQASNCLPPEYTRCLLHLSPGGKDASVVREFDVTKKAFVEDGFRLPEGKHRITWFNANTLLLHPDFGGETTTTSGYPNSVRLWKRGENPQESRSLLKINNAHVSVSSWDTLAQGQGAFVIKDSKTFYTTDYYLLKQDASLQKLEIPDSVIALSHFDGRLILQLRADWKTARRTFKAGSVVALALEGKNTLELIFEPNEGQSVSQVGTLKDGLSLVILDNVVSKAFFVQRSKESGEWKTQPVELPGIGTSFLAATSKESNDLFLEFTSFLTPASLLHTRLSSGKEKVSVVTARESQFNARGLIEEQRFAKSKDGTRVPYFIVRRKDVALNGSNPTLLYGYGGFEISLTPEYSGSVGKGWLEQGGIWVEANIRGGGEFGPKWHQAALLENRQRAYDDFIAIAEDLIRTGVTSPRRLGIMGGSNGGLLVGAVFVQRPDLFNAVVCQVPLLDMLRYHKLLAGASWMGEYGNPDENTPAARAIRQYSPYQNVKDGVKYPEVFFRTSTKDDRVHPGHARKMVAKMIEQGHTVRYYENMEGGHAGGADPKQRALMSAMDYTFLLQKLKD